MVLLTKIKVVVLLSVGIAKDFVAETREPYLFSNDIFDVHGPFYIRVNERHVPGNHSFIVYDVMIVSFLVFTMVYGCHVYIVDKISCL